MNDARLILYLIIMVIVSVCMWFAGFDYAVAYGVVLLVLAVIMDGGN
jgi:hypothetical protein